MKRIGSRIRRAKPAATTVKITAPRTAMMRATMIAKIRTVMVIIMKRPRGRPLRANWERRKD